MVRLKNSFVILAIAAASISVSISIFSAAAVVGSDLNSDGRVDVVDLGILLSAWNRTDKPPADLNQDGRVDVVDLGILLSAWGGVASAPPPSSGSILFTSSNEDFSNPERGFMRQTRIWPDQAYSSSKLSRKDPTDSLVWIYFMLENYRDPRDGYGITVSNYQGRLLEPLGSGKGLDTIKAAFDDARRKGLKLVIRFTYNAGPGSTPDPNQANPDAPIDLVLQHINQLGPIIAQNSDIIAAVQAGFVGHWGEWHSSKYLHQHRKTIVDALLKAVPNDRMIQIRYPRYKEIFYGGPITSSEASSQTDRSRTAHQNDCFLADTTDGGTYRSKSGEQPVIQSSYCGSQDEVACWKGFIAAEGRFMPIGGETCRAANFTRAACSNALKELEMLHWSFLNNGFYQPVLDGWVSGGCMPEIRRRLGYRIVLTKATLPTSVKPGSSFNLQLELKNEGFAAMYNPRPVYAVIKNSSTRRDILLASIDPRKWEAGLTHTVNAAVAIPADLAPGTYTLALWLSDRSASLKNNPQYAVRFANTGIWEAATGLNILTDNFKIQN